MRRFALLAGMALLPGSVASASAEPSTVQDRVPQVLLVPVPGSFVLPVAMAQHPNSDDLYIVEKTGTVRAVRGGLVLDPVPVLDISSEVSRDLEQGLLGLAFSSDGKFIYVNFTNTAGDTRVVEFG
ncbi:MAG TPA: hypothetical protein VG602_01205, partial [Actinomycetota bacterium]|nr:hypothetical protein [Actinomycetota bacterium]